MPPFAVLPSARPILQTFMKTPWIAAEPVGERTVADRIPEQIQVAFRGEGPTRQLVPLTPAARELLHGSTRDAAHTFFHGIAAGVDGRAGARLLGVSLSGDINDFATNRMMSMVESGFLPNTTPATIAAGQRDSFMADFQAVADTSSGARAQNVGFMDLGPELSKTAIELIKFGAPSVGRDRLNLLAQVIGHELEHSVTPPKPGTTTKGGWLEEGGAEALSWWPGAIQETLIRIGAAAPGSVETAPPDPWSAPQRSLPSGEYWGYLRGTQRLLGMAGIFPTGDDGTPTPGARDAARTILQAEAVNQAPKNMARAIGRYNNLGAREVETLTNMLAESTGARAEVDAVEAFAAKHAGSGSSVAA